MPPAGTPRQALVVRMPVSVRPRRGAGRDETSAGEQHAIHAVQIIGIESTTPPTCPSSTGTSALPPQRPWGGGRFRLPLCAGGVLVEKVEVIDEAKRLDGERLSRRRAVVDGEQVVAVGLHLTPVGQVG